MEALKKITIKLDYSVVVNTETGAPKLTLMRNEERIHEIHDGYIANHRWLEGMVSNNVEEALAYIYENREYAERWENENLAGHWVVIREVVWKIKNDSTEEPGQNYFESTGISVREYVSQTHEGHLEVELNPKDRLWIKCGVGIYEYFSSKFVFSWTTRGDSVVMGCLRPLAVLEALLGKMGAECTCSISDKYDKRLSDVLLLPAECIRGIQNPRVYSSFSDFSGWMEAVFGYVYVIDEEHCISLLRLYIQR